MEAAAADPGWTGSAWTAPITPVADNILSPSYLDEDSYAYNGLCDRVYDLSCLLHGKCDIVWNFPKPATISAINLYSGWGNTGRADIYVTSVSVKYAADGEWVVLDNSEVRLYASSIGSKVKGRYAMSDGSTLASGIVALKMTFPEQQNGYVGIYEAEVSGAFDEALDPEVFPYTFDFGDYTVAEWTPSEGNMMQFCSSMSKTTITTPGSNSGIVRTTTDITSSHSHMIDKTVGTTSNRQIEPGAVVTWTFATPFTLEAFKVFSHWNDKGRDAIVIYDFEVMDGDGVWTRLFDSSHPVLLGTTSSADLFTAAGGASGGTGHLWFALMRTDGDPIATDVAAIRVRTGSGSSYGIGWNDSFWTEVEAIGSRSGGGAAATLGAGSLLSGEGCGIEIRDGATLSIRTGGHTEFCNDAEIVLDGGSVSDAGYFVWSGAASALGGHIVFGPEGGEFISPNTHKFKAMPATPLELRYELPGQTWSGYSRAPLRLGWINDYNQFGMGGKVFVNVAKGMEQLPSRTLEIPLIETTHANAYIHTNDFTFAAFGTNLVPGESSPKGDRFLWTYDHDGSLSPATPGSLPTGLVFDYAGRQSFFVIIVR